MATGGTGDVLSGMIASEIVQEKDFSGRSSRPFMLTAWPAISPRRSLSEKRSSPANHSLSAAGLESAGRARKSPSGEVVTTHSEEETFRLARGDGLGFNGTEVVLLVGELGAGKTVFAKGLASGAGVMDVNGVSSPSFTLVNIYQGRHRVFHIDLYRLEREAEIVDLGWEDIWARDRDRRMGGKADLSGRKG